jgi:hypothetical protein
VVSVTPRPRFSPGERTPGTHCTGGGEKRCSSCSFSTSALDKGERSASRPGRALAPEKGPPVPFGQEAGWTPEPVWTQRLEEKQSCAPTVDRTSITRLSSLWSDTILTELPRLLYKVYHNFKGHKFMWGPQDLKIFSLGPRQNRSWPSLV